MIKRQRWIRGPDFLFYGKQTCSSALNSTSLVMVGAEEGFVNVFDFNSKKWEEVNPGIQEFIDWLPYYRDCSSTITFSKDSKQKLMVLLKSETGQNTLKNTLISHEGELSEGQWHQVLTFESNTGIDVKRVRDMFSRIPNLQIFFTKFFLLSCKTR